MKKYLLLSLCLLLGLGAFAQRSSALEPELQEIIDQKGDEMISVNIILKSQIDNETLNARLNDINGKGDKRLSAINEMKTFATRSQQGVISILQAEERSSKVSDINAHWMVNVVNCTTTRDVIYRLSEHPDVHIILYNKEEKLIDDSNPVKTDKQRGMAENVMTVNANDVWNEGYTGEDVIVAVLDTGVNIDHVDLADHLWDGSYLGYPYHGWNCVEDNEYTYDYHSHGTHCAGTICGDGTSGTQTGVAPDATLMCVKILNDEGEGTLEDFIEGVEFAVYNGAQVLSISVGWTYPSTYVSEVMRELFENVLASGVVASVAAGNDRDEVDSYPIPRNINAPGNCPPPYLSNDQLANPGGMSAVVTVGAVDYYDEAAYFTSEGPVTWQDTYYGDYAYSNEDIIFDENWLYYDNGNFHTSIGVGSTASFYWGVKFSSEVLQRYAGKYLTEVSMYDYSAHTGTILIYSGGDTMPEALVHCQAYEGTGSAQFVNYDLTTPITIDTIQNLWIIMVNDEGVEYPAPASEFTGNADGSWCSLDGINWYDIAEPTMLGEPLTWMIRAYVTDEFKGEVAELQPITDYEYTASTGKLVASNTNNDTKDNSTSFGLIRPDISAPGVDIISTAYDDNYGFYSMSGTSMATPCVAGVMALMLDKNPNLTPSDICRLLEETATPLTTNKSNLTGSGRIDAFAAINEIEGGNNPDNPDNSYSEEIMYTTYDLQSNGQVANRMYHREDGSVAVVAMMSHDYDQSASDRGTAYNFFDGSSWGDYPYERVEANATGYDMRTGWPSIAPYGENGEILVNHSDGLNYYIRETAGEGLWDGPYSIPAFDYSYSLSWPRVVTSGENNEIIHVVAAAQNTDNNGNTVTTQFYCRSTDGENWEVNYSPLVETNEHIGIYSADDYCVSANGDVVAVVYATPFHGDVLMFKSTDNGLSWTKYVVWENPYKGNWETDDETITEDVAQTPTMSTVAVGPDGVVHVAFSVANYVHSELGTTFSYYHGRTVDGIAYWNDRREPISNIKLWNEGEDGYMHHSYDSINFCGWMPFYDNIAEFDNNMIYRENDYIYTFYGACSGYPALSVDTEGNLALAYSTIDSRRNNGSHYYRSVFVSYKAAGDESWNVAVEDLTEDFMFTLTEAISVSSASVSAKENEFWFSFLGDDTHGFYQGADASQSSASDNYVYVSKFVPGEYGDDDDNDDNNDEITQAYRKVLIETFTGKNCGYDPDAHKIANELAAANPGRVFPINIHCGGFSPTSYPNMNTTVGTEMMNAYNVQGFPCGNINRNSESPISRSQWSSETYNQLSQMTEVNVSGLVKINPLVRVAEITVDLEYVSSGNYNTNYLTVMMLQDSIWGSQSGGSSNPEQYVNGQYCHMHVLRDIITPTWGDAVSPTTAGTHITKTYIYEIPEIIGDPNGVDVDLNNIYFLAFVTEAYQGTPTRPVLNVDKLELVNDNENPECDAPTDLTYYIDEFDYNNVTLSWTAPAGADSANVTYGIYSTSTSMTPLYHGISETSFTIEDLAAGNYRYVVRANWNDECLSAPSNMVEFTIADCAPDDMIELTITMSDSYGDGWNGGNIEIVGETNGSTYTVTLNDGSNDTITLSLCPDVYYFNWNNGVYDGEVGFEIFVEENEVYSVAEGTIDDSFSNPFFVLRFEDIFASISDVTYTSAFCSTETNFNINVVNEGLQEITSLKMEVAVESWDFEDGMEGWTIIDGNNDAHTWYHNSLAGDHSTLSDYSHTGVGHLMSESYCNAISTPMSPDDYLVSPYKIAVTAGTTMSFWACAQDENYQAEHFGVAVSTAGNTSASDFTTISEWTIGAKVDAKGAARGNREQTSWVKYEVDLSSYAGQEVWVAIRHFGCYDQFILLVDDVEITSCNGIEFTWQGSIPSYQSANIETTLDLPVGHHKVDFRIVEINGVPFQTSKSIDVNVEEGIDTYVNGNSGEYTIDVMTNGYGGTISWEIVTSDNSVLSSGEFSNNGTYLNTETVTIPAGECVRFIIRNSNNNFNNGYYRIFDGKGNVVVYNEGNFGYEQSYLLSVISDDNMDDSYAENTFNVNVDVPGTLSYKLAAMIEHWSDVYVLKVNGELNTSDFDVFSKCTHLMTLDLTQTNITSIGGCKELSRLRNVYLPTTVTSVNNQAFYNCKSLYSMDLPNATTIGYRAFYNCYSLTSINIPNVTSIDYDAFAYCQSLTSIDISNATNLSNNNNYGIFGHCTDLSEVVLSDELTYIPYECFYYCTSLQEINLPASLKTINGYAFYGCALTDINIPEGVTSIANYAFNGCPATTISIPSSITSIGSYVFSNGNITDVYCYAATPVTTSTFNGGLSYATLHVPEFSVVAYKVHDSWYKFNIVALDELLSDVYINSDYTIVDYNGLADEVNLTLDRNAHLTVTAGSEFNLNNYKQITSNTEYYEYDNNWNYTYYYPSTLITYNEMNADNVEVSLVLRTDRWNFISLPFDVNVSDITYPEGTLWVVRKYSGEDRANMTGNTWHNMTDGMTLNAGEGYILHCDHGNTSYVTFTFPAVNNESMNNMFTYQDFEQHLEIYPSEFAHNRSWNLVGNPYPSYFNTNGNIEHNGIITVWDNAYVAYSLLDDYFTLKPYESFFVQCPDDATSMLFKTEGRSHTNDYDDYSKRDEAFRQRNSGDRKIYNFTLNNEEYSDRTRLVLNEAASVDYELSCDASKFMNEDENVPQIYVYDNEVIYAINERPLGLGVMSLGIRIGQAGEYTLTLDPKEEYGLKVVLYDNETREEIDILNGSYTFFAEEGYDNNRFVLTITENTIGVDENYVLDINDPDVEVYDIYGRRVRVSDVKNGLYILRKGDKVQRYFISE